MNLDYLKICVDNSHNRGGYYECARCRRIHCMTCDRSTPTGRVVKSIMHYCPRFNCQREKELEGDLTCFSHRVGRPTMNGRGGPEFLIDFLAAAKRLLRKAATSVGTFQERHDRVKVEFEKFSRWPELSNKDLKECGDEAQQLHHDLVTVENEAIAERYSLAQVAEVMLDLLKNEFPEDETMLACAKRLKVLGQP